MANQREQALSEKAEEMQEAAGLADNNMDLVDEACREERRTRVVVHNQEGVPGGMDDVFVAVNGRAYQIKREQEVDLPASVLNVLDNAVTDVMNQDGSTRPAKRFNYSVIRYQAA